jgi:hypothetical protein
MCWTVRYSNPCGGKRMSSFHIRPERRWGPTSLICNRYRPSFLVENRSRCVADHAPPSKAEATNVNGYASTVPLCACILCCYGETFTFTLYENIGLVHCPKAAFELHFTFGRNRSFPMHTTFHPPTRRTSGFHPNAYSYTGFWWKIWHWDRVLFSTQVKKRLKVAYWACLRHCSC